MATPFLDIYDVFMSKFSDSVFNSLDADDSLKYRYLLNAIPKFRRCKVDLSDRTDAQFNQTLSDEEIQILGAFVLIEYLNPMIVNIELIKQVMTDKDFRITSQAEHLKRLTDLRDTYKSEVQKMILDYTYNNSDLSELR